MRWGFMGKGEKEKSAGGHVYSCPARRPCCGNQLRGHGGQGAKYCNGM
jgi:hypothetical protein